jgi:enhancing lycopene biosynthesis protein 2
LVESARIARGQCLDLKFLKVDDYEALFMPGGFGMAKNFCNFSFKGKEMTVDE